MSDLEALSRRIQKVEAAYYRLKLAATLVVILVCAGLLLGQTRFEPLPRIENQSKRAPFVYDELRAYKIFLVDQKGKERASLVTDGTGSVFLVFFDANGQARADMHVSSYGPSINFYDPSGRSRMILGSTPLVGSHVASPQGQVEKSPPSSVVLFDKDGKLLWRMP